MRRDDLATAALEKLPPFARNRLGILQVLLEEVPCESGVQAVDVSHPCLCSSARGAAVLRRLPERIAGDHRDGQTDRERGRADVDRRSRQTLAPAADRGCEQGE